MNLNEEELPAEKRHKKDARGRETVLGTSSSLLNKTLMLHATRIGAGLASKKSSRQAMWEICMIF